MGESKQFLRVFVGAVNLLFFISGNVAEGQYASSIDSRIRTLESEYLAAAKSNDIDRAIRNGEQLIRILESSGPQYEGRLHVAQVNLASILSETGRFAESDRLLDASHRLVLNRYGEQSEQNTVVLIQQAKNRIYTGRYRESHRLYNEAYAIRKRLYGERSAKLGDVLHGLSHLYDSMGSLSKAEECFLETIRLYTSTLPKSDPRVLDAYTSYGSFLDNKGDYDGALDQYKKALALLQVSRNQEVTFVTSVLVSTGRALKHKGLYTNAEKIFKDCLQLQQKTLGPKHPVTARSLSLLTSIYAEIGEYEKSYEYQKQVQEMYLAIYGPQHPFVASAYNDAGYLLTYLGRYKEAHDMLSRSAKLFQRTLGNKHPFYANTLANQAVLKVREKNYKHAVVFLRQANAIYENLVRTMMGVGREKEKIAYLQKISGKTHFTIWLGVQAASSNPEAQKLAYITTLERKGRVVDAVSNSTAAIRSTLDKRNQAVFDELIKVREQIARQTYAGKLQNNRQFGTLLQQAQGLERKLSQSTSSIHFRISTLTPKAIQNALPEKSILLEYVRYRPYDPAVPKATQFMIQEHYAVCVVQRESAIQWFDLGPAKVIDQEISRYRSLIFKDPKKQIEVSSGKLYQYLIQPVEATFSNRQLLLIAPDNTLNGIPFGALKNRQGKYLIELYPIDVLCSGRDLLTMADAGKANLANGITIFADPDFNAQPGKGLLGLLGRLSRDQKSFSITPLPGTAKELEKLKKIFPQAQSYQGARATEEQLKQLPPRRLLHIATHGYFLPDEAFDLVRIPTKKGQEQLYLLPAPPENPLVRSGLTFAGVNHLRSGADDGFLTALEMSGLNMQGTELVVLSACDTGLGDIVPGEGVFGIRRALQIAGARTVVLTLWPVHDQATHFLMDTFYREIQRGNKRVDALRKAQLSLLQGKYKHPQYWGAFTICGNWRKLAL